MWDINLFNFTHAIHTHKEERTIDLCGIRIPNIDVMIIWTSDKQPSVNWIPRRRGYGIFMTMFMLLVNDKYRVVLFNLTTFHIISCTLYIINSNSCIRCTSNQISSFCQINLILSLQQALNNSFIKMQVPFNLDHKFDKRFIKRAYSKLSAVEVIFFSFFFFSIF